MIGQLVGKQGVLKFSINMLSLISNTLRYNSGIFFLLAFFLFSIALIFSFEFFSNHRSCRLSFIFNLLTLYKLLLFSKVLSFKHLTIL